MSSFFRNSSKTTAFRSERDTLFPSGQQRAEYADTRTTGVPGGARSTLEEDENKTLSQKRHDDVPGVIDLDDDDISMELVDNIEMLPKLQRGSKRHADIANEVGSGKKSGKRARRQSQKHGDSPEAEHMDMDNLSRGTKRDRADAESSFGDESSGRKNRKTSRHAQPAVDSVDSGSATNGIRGLKRSFETESTIGSAEEDELSPVRHSASRKRGKHAGVAPTIVEVDPACGGRQIDEEWQANGLTFKVGTDGCRLRQVLIKTRRSLFSMVSNRIQSMEAAQCFV